jgi:uncharacterized membrane protein YfcA
VAPLFVLNLSTPQNLAISFVLLPLAVVATWCGVWLVRRVSTKRFYFIIYPAMIGVGGKLIWGGVRGLI